MKEYLKKTDDENFEITAEGYEYLDAALTDSHGNVYAFTGDNLSSTTAAAAMARLSRSPHDMRVTILKEFAEAGKDEALLRRVVTMYGDDSVQQLVGLHVAVENASNLLTKYVEWGRLASYLEQSTRYIFYDARDATGHYKYHTPDLPKSVSTRYRQDMDKIFEGYSDIVHKLVEHISETSSTPTEERDGAWKAAVRAQACDAARPLLPVATRSTVGIFGSAQAIEAMIMRLRAHPNAEAQACGEAILKQVRQVIPTFFERADKPERGGGTSAYLAATRESVAHIAEELLPSTKPQPQAARATLSRVYPTDEYELVPDMLYSDTNQSLADITQHAAGFDDETKARVFDSYFGTRLNRRHKPGRAVENAHYTFDIVCDYGIFRDLQRHRIVDDLRWQLLTPRLGYDVPSLVSEAGLGDDFRTLFAIAESLYDELARTTDAETAQYASLLGHNMRWRISFNAREAFHLLELRTAPQGHPGYRILCKQMYDEIAKVHPNIARHMEFINKDEDPQLTRLAAERATQRKLDALEDISAK